MVYIRADGSLLRSKEIAMDKAKLIAIGNVVVLAIRLTHAIYLLIVELKK